MVSTQVIPCPRVKSEMAVETAVSRALNDAQNKSFPNKNKKQTCPNNLHLRVLFLTRLNKVRHFLMLCLDQCKPRF